MQSALRRLRNQARGKPPVVLGDGRRYNRGLIYNLGAGRADRETMLRQYGLSGTLYGIISLLAESSATPAWKLYKKQPVDGRRRYSTTDQGSDQRIEVVQHPAIQLWNEPNGWHSGFEFREGAQQHQELTGETFWVLDTENALGVPTSMWYVRPDRMEPLPDPDDYLAGWIYNGPTGEQVPLRVDEVILEKRPDPLDPYRGAGPVASIMPNIQQQRYATEYQRNLFLNGADPGGIITVPNRLTDEQFDEVIDRWRESHRGVARAGHVGVLEDGMTWQGSASSNRDLEYSNLRLTNRDELREAWRIHKAMMGSSDDVNRANAQTAQEVFVAWQVISRLNRRRDTLNSKLLPLYGATGANVEFDYDDPSPVNAETASAELLAKAQSALALIQAGYEPHAVLETVGLPDMDTSSAGVPVSGALEQSLRAVPAGSAPELPDASPTPTALGAPNILAKDAAAKVFQMVAPDYPAHATAWMHHAAWAGPVMVPLDHIKPTLKWMEAADPAHVQDFVKRRQEGKKLKPVILVKAPGSPELLLVDGHHRYLAEAELDEPVRAFIGTVDSPHGGWEAMHDYQYGDDEPGGKTPKAMAISPAAGADMAALLRRVLTDGYTPVEIGSR